MEKSILLPLLIASLLANGFFFFIQNRFEKIFKSLLPEIRNLKNLLSNSTGNIDKLIQENKNLRNEVESLKKNKTNLLTVKKGDKVICKQELTAKKEKHSFEVLYECNVIEATEGKLKLNALDFKSDDDWANRERKLVIDFFQDKWIDRSICEIIMDKEHIRNYKLEDILNGI